MSLLNVGARALQANQVALSTIGHNISNANTAGYSRQTVALATVQGQFSGGGYVGKGVTVQTIARNYDALLTKQASAASSVSASDTVRSQYLAQMQDVFVGGEYGVGAAVNDMLNAFADIVSVPTDTSARHVALTRMDELTERFHVASDSLDELEYSTRERLQNNIVTVNSLAQQVASLNGEIARAKAVGHEPNDLLDKRDQAIREINQFIQTSQIAGNDGAISLFVGSSQPLVLGVSAGTLSVDTTKQYPNSNSLSLYFQQAGGQQLELQQNMLHGGEINGLLSFANNDLAEGRNLLGRMITVVATEMNDRNKLGLRLDGSLGSELFSVKSTLNGYSNIPALQASTVSFNDLSKLQASDYKVTFTAGTGGADVNMTVVRLSDGKTTTTSHLSADFPHSFNMDGLDFSIPTAGTPGQSILFQPYAAAAGQIKALVLSPNDLAASSSVLAQIPQTNGGTLQLTSVFANTLPTPQNTAQLTLSFSVDAGTGEIAYNYPGSVGGPFAFTAGNPMDIGGTSVTLNGTPHDGDTVTLYNQLGTYGADTKTTPLTAQVSAANSGQMQVDRMTITAAAANPTTLTLPLDIKFSVDGLGNISYTYAGGAPVAYTAGDAITIDGYSIELSGAPRHGDVLSLRSLGDAFTRDGGNADAFLSLRDAKLFDNGTTVTDSFSAIMAQIGTRTQSAQYAAQLSTSIYESLENSRTSISGVNLDEEASALLQYQQAYQSSAKMLQIAQSLFDSVLNAVR